MIVHETARGKKGGSDVIVRREEGSRKVNRKKVLPKSTLAAQEKSDGLPRGKNARGEKAPIIKGRQRSSRLTKYAGWGSGQGNEREAGGRKSFVPRPRRGGNMKRRNPEPGEEKKEGSLRRDERRKGNLHWGESMLKKKILQDFFKKQRGNEGKVEKKKKKNAPPRFFWGGKKACRLLGRDPREEKVGMSKDQQQQRKERYRIRKKGEHFFTEQGRKKKDAISGKKTKKGAGILSKKKAQPLVGGVLQRGSKKG